MKISTVLTKKCVPALLLMLSVIAAVLYLREPKHASAPKTQFEEALGISQELTFTIVSDNSLYGAGILLNDLGRNLERSFKLLSDLKAVETRDLRRIVMRGERFEHKQVRGLAKSLGIDLERELVFSLGNQFIGYNRGVPRGHKNSLVVSTGLSVVIKNIDGNICYKSRSHRGWENPYEETQDVRHTFSPNLTPYPGVVRYPLTTLPEDGLCYKTANGDYQFVKLLVNTGSIPVVEYLEK